MLPELDILQSSCYVPLCKNVDKAWKDSEKNRFNGIFRDPGFLKRDDDFSLSFKQGVDNLRSVKVEKGKGRNSRVVGLETFLIFDGDLKREHFTMIRRLKKNTWHVLWPISRLTI